MPYSNHRILKNLLLLLALLIAATSHSVVAQVRLAGTVSDAVSGMPLAAAHIELTGTGKGTITNATGDFLIVVDQLPISLKVRFIGYTTTIVEVVSSTDPIAIRLERETVELDEVLVSTEDLARRLMRDVIRKKQERNQYLDWFRREGYVRLSLARDQEIQVISQHIFTDYDALDMDRRTIVRASSETSDIYRALGLNPVQDRIDLNDDYVSIGGLRFVGPTHPDALDVYSFVLGDRRLLDGQTVYDIFVSPLDDLRATFIGTVSVLGEESAIIEAKLRPARHVQFPTPVKSWDIVYEQQYDAAADSFWLPVDFRASGEVHIDPDDRGFEPATVEVISQLSNYRINSEERPSIFQSSEAVVFDSAFVLKQIPYLPGSNIVPLTPRETEALGTLVNERKTIEHAFLSDDVDPTLAQFEGARTPVDVDEVSWPTIYAYNPWLRLNRVDGFFLGVGRIFEFSPQLSVNLRAAQTTGFERVRFNAKAIFRHKSRMTFSGSYEANTRATNPGSVYSAAAASLGPIFGQQDYFDFYWSRRLEGSFGYALNKLRFSVGLITESVDSAPKKLDRLWPYTLQFRTNPEIPRGRHNAVHLKTSIGDPTNPLALEPVTRLEIDLTASDDLAGSDFSYLLARVTGEAYFRTLFRHRPFPDIARILVQAKASQVSDGGLIDGVVVDGAIAGFSRYGAIKSHRIMIGARHSSGLFWEHQFASLTALMPTLFPKTSRSYISIHGSNVGSWVAPPEGDTGPLVFRASHEVGVSVSEMLKLPLRFDITYRLDDPGYFIGFGLTRLWN